MISIRPNFLEKIEKEGSRELYADKILKEFALKCRTVPAARFENVMSVLAKQ